MVTLHANKQIFRSEKWQKLIQLLPAKAPKKKSAAKAKKAGPGVGDLIVKALSSSKERSGVSLAALKKALAAAGYDVEKNNSRVKLAIKSMVTKGTLLQVKGTGASGSFKISKKQAETKKKVAPNAKKLVWGIVLYPLLL